MITLRAFRNGDESGEMVTVELRTREEAVKMLDTHGLELFSITGDDEEVLQQDGIKVFGHEGTWYVIDTLVHNGKTYRLLEHEQHGDEALCVAIDEEGNPVAQDISDGITELALYLDDQASKLPELCYSTHMMNEDRVIIIKRDESGYYPTELEGGRQTVDELNKKLEVSRYQEEAMVIGSMFGWDKPGACPAYQKARYAEKAERSV